MDNMSTCGGHDAVTWVPPGEPQTLAPSMWIRLATVGGAESRATGLWMVTGTGALGEKKGRSESWAGTG